MNCCMIRLIFLTYWIYRYFIVDATAQTASELKVSPPWWGQSRPIPGITGASPFSVRSSDPHWPLAMCCHPRGWWWSVSWGKPGQPLSDEIIQSGCRRCHNKRKATSGVAFYRKSPSDPAASETLAWWTFWLREQRDLQISLRVRSYGR
jgi:hypothetical protein